MMNNELRIHTQIHNRYQVFDASGRLPFSIVFGFCRRSSADTDPRSVLFEIAGSVLDIPYAIAHGYLTLHEQSSESDEGWSEVDVSQLSQVVPKETEYLSLPSPVNRTQHWRDSFTVYQCQIDVDRELASILKPGKKYRIRLANENLRVKRWAYSDREQLVDNDGKPNQNLEAGRLINSKPTASNATFTVVENLPWPPRIETQMRLCEFSQSADPTHPDVTRSRSVIVEISVINTGSDSVTVQTRGQQRFLKPWDPFQPEPDAEDDRVRIIDPGSHKPPTSSLQVIACATGEVVRGVWHYSGIAPLTSGNADRRPKVDDLVTLEPRTPIVKKFDIGALVDGLSDGQYRIRMQPKGCRWWHGQVKQNGDKDGKVPAHLGSPLSPPLMLETQDELEIYIKDGKVDRSP